MEVDEQLEELFHDTAEAHHVAFQATDGADDDWAIWYAEYLMDHGIGTLLEAKFIKSDLIYMLLRAAREQAVEAPGSKWEWY